MQNKWVRFLKGYLMLRLHGDYVERFFNMCRMHDILLWNIRKEGTDFCCSMAARDYLTTIPLMKKTGTRATVLKKMGLPFYAPQMRKRALFFLSLFVCLGLLYAVTGNVWALEFVGNRQISEEELQDFLAEENIFYGMKKEALNCEQIEKHLRARFPNVTWTSVYFQGTKLFVEVKENEKTEPAAQERKGTNLVAQENGTIVSMITRNGVPKVKIGSVIEPGQLLVEGCVPIYDEGQQVMDYQIYRSDADIYIQTELSYQTRIEKRYPSVQYTGREQESIFMEILGYHIESRSFGKEYESCERIVQRKQVSLLENMYLPIYYGRIHKRQYHLQYLEYSEEEMKKQLNDDFEKFLSSLEQKGVQIIEKNVKMNRYIKGMELKAQVSVIKQTGKEEAITDKKE